MRLLSKILLSTSPTISSIHNSPNYYLCGLRAKRFLSNKYPSPFLLSLDKIFNDDSDRSNLTLFCRHSRKHQADVPTILLQGDILAVSVDDYLYVLATRSADSPSCFFSSELSPPIAYCDRYHGYSKPSSRYGLCSPPSLGSFNATR